VGIRSDIFLKPASEIFDFAWFELKRLSFCAKKSGFKHLVQISYEVENFVRSIEPFVDQRLVKGSRCLGIETCESPTKEDLVCDLWNAIRANILWLAPKVNSGFLPIQILDNLLLINKKMAATVRLINPLHEDGSQRFSIVATTEATSVEAMRLMRNGFLTQYAALKKISVGEVPLYLISKQWRLPLNGWTRDLAEEVGRVSGDIESIKLTADASIPKVTKYTKISPQIFRDAMRFASSTISA